MNSRYLIKKLLTVPKRYTNIIHNSTNTYLYRDAKAMSAVSGKKLNEILEGLEKFAPLKLAEKWDNVGLLVDPMVESPIKTILLTNDLTEDVVDEAIQLKTGLIISYHPNIFQGLKSVSSRTWKERIVIRCLQSNIAVFSPHTSWDAIQGGVNGWLGKAFPVNTSTPILVNESYPSAGAGRLLSLTHPVTIGDAVRSVKNLTGLSHVRLALARNKDQDSTITTVALCAGSGSSVLKGQKTDLYLTGEMLHHDILEATQNGTTVILCNHSDSERGFLKEFQPRLQNEILNGCVEVHVSKVDKDPLITV